MMGNEARQVAGIKILEGLVWSSVRSLDCMVLKQRGLAPRSIQRAFKTYRCLDPTPQRS